MNTVFLLLAEFGSGHVELEKVCEKYVSISPKIAFRRAASASLPFPVMKSGSQKGTWLVALSDLALYLDTERFKARSEWEKANG